MATHRTIEAPILIEAYPTDPKGLQVLNGSVTATNADGSFVLHEGDEAVELTRHTRVVPSERASISLL